MNIDGNEVTKYVSCADWSPNAATTSGDSITISGGGRCYITNTPELAAETFYKFYPVDKKLCFDVNNSKVHCNCNSALYILKMPARKEDGSIDTDNPYCDCDAVGGNYCPDFDISEANKYALQVTPHPCSPPNANGHYTECDK